MPVHPPTTRPRKHNKTFTGCWTCRARKVKCDEARPACRQCNQKRVPCGGYAVRLHWLPSETGLEEDSQPLCDTPYQSRSRRSRIVADTTHDALSFPVDEILVAIDALRPGQVNQEGTRNESSGFIGGFGVFDSSTFNDREVDYATAVISDTGQEEICLPLPPSGIQGDVGYDIDLDEACTDAAAASLPATSTEDLSAIQGPFTTLEPLGREEDPSLQFDQFDTFGLQDDEGIQNTTWQITLSPVASPSLSSDFLTSNERLLMHYYCTRVVNFFPVLDSPKSPWKTIHLPRALQSAGELAIHGSTSQIRAALRSTLLSISAFYLSKHNRSQSRTDEATKWEREAMHYHGTAMNLLKDSVTRSTSTVRPKYKELLATMLSMISIDVMSGNTASCGLHLNGAYRLIVETMKWKSHYSNKAKALHRVYFYLRTMFESTAIPVANATPLPQPNTESPLSNSSEMASDRTRFASPFTGLDGINQVGGYESIYAIPQSLLFFLAETTDLINTVTEIREISGSTHIPSPLAERCDELETRIMDWQADSTPDIPCSSTANIDIIQNMTRAFHNAVMIFFAQNIRLLGHRYLKHFVEDVIESIEAVERIKVQWQVSASPLYWPAFIAASEAFDPRLQDRFRAWYAQVEVYAIGCKSPGISLLEDVWAEGPSSGGKTSLWRQIATRTNKKLMLT